MPRYRNTVSGVVVSVDAEAAMRLPDSWKPIEESTGAAKKTARKRPSRRKPNPQPTEPDEPTEPNDE